VQKSAVWHPVLLLLLIAIVLLLLLQVWVSKRGGIRSKSMIKSKKGTGGGGNACSMFDLRAAFAVIDS